MIFYVFDIPVQQNALLHEKNQCLNRYLKEIKVLFLCHYWQRYQTRLPKTPLLPDEYVLLFSQKVHFPVTSKLQVVQPLLALYIHLGWQELFQTEEFFRHCNCSIIQDKNYIAEQGYGKRKNKKLIIKINHKLWFYK
jgi:hypothetical protein